MWDPLQIHPPLGPASLLAHCLESTFLRVTTRRLAHCSVSGSDTIWNDPDPLLADIVLFGLSLSGFPYAFESLEGKPERESSKRTISASGGYGSLQEEC